MADPQTRITQILHAGDETGEELLPLVYDQLRQLARRRIARERPGQTLQPTALVHEAFLRLGCPDDPQWTGRSHFFRAAAEAMRRILIESARRKARLRHGGDRDREPLDQQELVFDGPDLDLLALDEALQELEAADPRAREVVNLRYFAGLTTAETAAAMGLSTATVEREWRFLRTFLRDALGESPPHAP